MDPAKALFSDLKSGDPDVRFSVLSRIEGLKWTEELEAAFLKLINEETEPNLKFQMQKAMAMIQRGRSSESKSHSIAAEIEILLKNPNPDYLTLALSLETVGRAEGALVSIQLREAHWYQFPDRVIPAILQFLKKYGSFEDIAHIEAFCRHPDPRILACAVEALEKLNPDSLKELMVPLLINPIPGIRSRAIRFLYRWDPDEALRHFEYMLFSETREDRLAALFHAYFFPFAKIELPMLKFLGMESDPDLLARAGLLFRANPMPAIPPKLLVARETSSGEKKRILGEIFSGVVESLFKAKLLKIPVDRYINELETRLRDHKAKLLIDHCSIALTSGNKAQKKSSVIRLFDIASHGYREALDTIKIRYQNETDPELKSLIGQRLESLEPAAEEPEINFFSLPQQKRLHFLDNIDAGRLSSLRPKLEAHLAACPVEERIVLINTLGRIGEKCDSKLVLNYLRDSDARVLSAAVETITALDPDAILPFLPQLLRNKADDVRAATVRVFALFDKKQAISLVDKMLHEISPAQRSLAIFSAGCFDFPSVRDILFSALQREHDPENIRQLCKIFRANLDDDLYMDLTANANQSSGIKQEILRSFILECASIMIEDGKTTCKSPEELQFTVNERLKAEEKKRQSALPAYSLSNIKKIRSEGSFSKTESTRSLMNFAVVIYGTAAILTALVWFVFLAPKSEKHNTATENARPLQPELSKTPFNVNARIIECLDEYRTLIIRTEAGEKYRVSRSEPFPGKFREGAAFRGQIKPLKRDGDAIICELIAVY